MLKDSTRCLVYGLLGLLPFIGLPFALIALWLAGRVRVREKKYWNAAKSYCFWGGASAAFGAIFWFLLLVLICYSSTFSDNR